MVLRPIPDLPEGPSTRTEPPRGSLDPSQTSASFPRPVPDLLELSPTRPRPPQWSPNLCRISPRVH